MSSLFITKTIILGLLTIPATGGSVEDLRQLEDDFWSWQMLINPTISTGVGMYEYNDLMEPYDVQKFETQRNKTLEFVQRLNAINRNDLEKSDNVNFDILEDSLQTFLDGNLWARYGALSPVTFLGGIQLYTGPSMAWKSSTRGDFENYIARLYAVQKQVDEMKHSMRLAIQLNRTLHNVSLARVPTQIDRKIFNTSEDSPYYTRIFVDRLNASSVPKSEWSYIQSRGKDAVSAYMDAFRDLKNFIENEYMPYSREEWGVSAWDTTNEYYKACLKWHLSFEMDPMDVHNKGLEEVERIVNNMNKIMGKFGFSGSIGEFFSSLEGDPRFYSNDTDEILAKYNDTVFKRINPKLSQYFKNIPDVPLVIEASTSDGLGGGYSSATENEPGRFTINLFRPQEVPFFEMMVLSLHEANPGHHLQQSFSMKANLPDFRKDPILTFNVLPNWYPFYSAYVEGWALYTEYLGEEMGLYTDEYELMGRYSYEIMRACRLVVDTGLHYLNWTREEAIAYMTDHTALGRGSAENEIDRYITWPGQACAYKLGEIKIKELRQLAEMELGSKFDIKEFHFVVLENGAMPMHILETIVTDWISKVKAADVTSKSQTVTGARSFVILTVLCTHIILSVTSCVQW